MKKKEAIVFSSLFLICIFGFFVLNFLNPSNVKSIVENRELQQKPTISFESLKDGSYFRTFETYYTDQFIGRNQFIKMYTVGQLKNNKSLVNNYHITNENWILAEPTKRGTYNDQLVKNSIFTIASVAKEIEKQGKEAYYVSTPHKTLNLDDMYPSYFATSYMHEVNDNYLNALNKEGVKVIDLDSSFKENNSISERQELYFKTDHHWNALGAFEGFKLTMDRILESSNTVDSDEFNVTYLKGKDLLGSWNKQLYGLIDKDTTIPMVIPKDTSALTYQVYNDGKWISKQLNQVVATGMGKQEVEYGDVYTWDIPYWKITNDKAKLDKKVLIFKDSYQNPTSLFFGSEFKETIIADLRNVRGVSGKDIIQHSNADIVLIMYNNTNFQGELFDFNKVR